MTFDILSSGCRLAGAQSMRWQKSLVLRATNWVLPIDGIDFCRNYTSLTELDGVLSAPPVIVFAFVSLHSGIFADRLKASLVTWPKWTANSGSGYNGVPLKMYALQVMQVSLQLTACHSFPVNTPTKVAIMCGAEFLMKKMTPLCAVDCIPCRGRGPLDVARKLKSITAQTSRVTRDSAGVSIPAPEKMLYFPSHRTNTNNWTKIELRARRWLAMNNFWQWRTALGLLTDVSRFRFESVSWKVFLFLSGEQYGGKIDFSDVEDALELDG